MTDSDTEKEWDYWHFMPRGKHRPRCGIERWAKGTDRAGDVDCPKCRGY